ncbi:MAG TPA: type II toxin-antitoxin system VapC family toxin [Candidatus Saccharimonadales bacterium]|nr:type II toxin-antitoxin system VapC family toxin [Candidatus Saccharimonadales bacterium]
MTKKKQTKQENNLPKQKIILDTNIFSDLTDQHLAIPLNTYLSDLVKRGFDFAISDITLYESIRGLSMPVKKNELIY